MNNSWAAPLRPFFSFYGGKWRASKHYPAPRYEHVVEPFAGSAGYSCKHWARRVVLVERDPVIAATWRYLMRVTPREILALPDIEPGQAVDDFRDVCQEGRWLIGWWLNQATTRPSKTLSAWGVSGPRADNTKYLNFWGPRRRELIAAQLPHIHHWTLIEGDYADAPDIPATWFIDPPYQVAGKHYRFGADRLDYAALADWCRSRRGQVLVCENTGADWLPFEHWRDCRANNSDGANKVSREAIWYRSGEEAGS